jgi:hypothetical protein
MSGAQGLQAGRHTFVWGAGFACLVHRVCRLVGAGTAGTLALQVLGAAKCAGTAG